MLTLLVFFGANPDAILKVNNSDSDCVTRISYIQPTPSNITKKMNFFHFLLILASIATRHVAGNNIICNSTHTCDNTIIDCNPEINATASNETCHIVCIGDNVCESTKIICDTSNDCNVQCHGSSSCEDAQITWYVLFF